MKTYSFIASLLLTMSSTSLVARDGLEKSTDFLSPARASRSPLSTSSSSVEIASAGDNLMDSLQSPRSTGTRVKVSARKIPKSLQDQIVAKAEQMQQERVSAEVRGVLPQGFSEELAAQTIEEKIAQHRIDKLVNAYKMASSNFKIMLKGIGLSKEDVPTLFKRMSVGDNYLLPAKVIAELFSSAETKDDIALGMIRLGLTAHNTHLIKGMSGDVDRSTLDKLAADSYYFASQWFYRGFEPILKETNTLLPQHHHSPFSEYFKTIEGRKEALGSALSIFKMLQWSLYRMGEDDPRANEIREDAATLFGHVDRFYRTHGLAHPSWGDLLHQGKETVESLAQVLTMYGDVMPASREAILVAFQDAARAEIEGYLKYMDKPTIFSVKDSGEPIYPKDILVTLQSILGEESVRFTREALPMYQLTFEQIKREMAKIGEPSEEDEA